MHVNQGQHCHIYKHYLDYQTGGGNYYMLTNISELLAINAKIIRHKTPKATYPPVIFERSHYNYRFKASNKY